MTEAALPGPLDDVVPEDGTEGRLPDVDTAQRDDVDRRMTEAALPGPWTTGAGCCSRMWTTRATLWATWFQDDEGGASGAVVTTGGAMGGSRMWTTLSGTTWFRG